MSNPMLVLIVGCFGLLSNILGLVLFHDHGHSHGGGGHAHSHGTSNDQSDAEEGHNHHRKPVGGHTKVVADETGNIADILPQATVGGWPKSDQLANSTREGPAEQAREVQKRTQGYTPSDEDDSTVTNSTSPISTRKSNTSSAQKRHRRRQNSASRSMRISVDDLNIHPASFRREIIAASRNGLLEDIESQAGKRSFEENAVEEEEPSAQEDTPLLHANGSSAKPDHDKTNVHDHTPGDDDGSWHADHKHQKQKEESAGGHSHGDLNMRGVFLHVMGDALGNIGVIGSALIIWLTDFKWRFYADPAISLIITIIILGSAIPLCKAASRILLQAVPPHISIDAIKEDIQELPGIVSCHHLHVWQLSDVKLVASLHVQVDFDFKGEGSATYMQLARAIRRCLHEYGIHSSTIQPEFCLDSTHHHNSTGASVNEERPKTMDGSETPSLPSQPETCLLDCGDECGEDGQCCAPAAAESDPHDGHTH